MIGINPDHLTHPGQRLSAQRENSWRRHMLSRRVVDGSDIGINVLPNGITLIASQALQNAITTTATASSLLVSHGHLDDYDGGYNTAGFTGPD